jgi:ParB/RepB/Spo0J family partition protein
LPSKINVERELGEFSKLCEIVEQPDGILVKPKQKAEDQFQAHFQEIYEKLIQMGAEYKLGKMEFLFPVLRPASDSVAGRERTLQPVSLNDLVQPSFSIRQEPDDVSELVDSVTTHGVLEPLVIRPVEDGKYEVIIGSRRLRAAERAGLEALLCIILEMSDQEAAELQWAENIDRKDLTDYEKGRWLKEMLEKFPEEYPNQAMLGNKIGLSQQHVSELVSHFEFVERQKETLPSDLTARAVKLTERVTREIQKAPEKSFSPRNGESCRHHNCARRQPRRSSQGSSGGHEEARWSREEKARGTRQETEAVLPS